MILVDTGPLVAALNRRDPQHEVCRTVLESRAGELEQVRLDGEVLERIAELLHRYANLHGGQGLSAADASVIACAEHRGIQEIITLDTTDFNLVRPRHVPHFTLLP
jgi:uncharacterized protein